MAATVLVTGGTGFVGSWCVVELLKRGYVVRATVRSLAKEAALRAMVAPQAGSTERLSVAAADLMHDEGWDAAMASVDYVLHVASPLGSGKETAEQLVGPAREGALRVLRAAVKAGVKRVVMTSSCAAATPSVMTATSVSDETVWTDPATLRHEPYRLSKVLSEKAAWDFMAKEGGRTEFVTVLPSAVFGPVLAKESLGSVQVIQRILDGRLARIPNAGVCVVDVRDLADVHIQAMISPEVAGQRFIASGGFMWLMDVARTLKQRLGERAARASTRPLPDFVVKFGAPFAAPLRVLRPLLGRAHRFSSDKAKRVLGYSPRPAAETVVDCAESLLAG